MAEEESAPFDIHLRFNDDMEKDYCFQVQQDQTFDSLFKIFDSLPIALRPNLFHKSMPVGFKVSTSPGYLTEDGYLLFDYLATKFSRPVRNVHDKIKDHVWPGQLVLPVWEKNDFGFYLFVSFLLVWLYTDLPDFISPTPGICLTNHVSKQFSALAGYFGQERLSKALIDDINEPVSITAQVIFFLFHIVKCLAIYMVIYSGLFNPIKLFRISSKNVKLNISVEELIALGWTGSKRATPDDYKEYYREYKIKEHGGMVPAHQAGLFSTLRNLGCYLGQGEGYSTPLDSKGTLDEVLKTGKVSLSDDYVGEWGKSFIDFMSDQDDTVAGEYTKQYRRYGLLHGSDVLKKVVAERKKEGDAKL